MYHERSASKVVSAAIDQLIVWSTMRAILGERYHVERATSETECTAHVAEWYRVREARQSRMLSQMSDELRSKGVAVPDRSS